MAQNRYAWNAPIRIALGFNTLDEEIKIPSTKLCQPIGQHDNPTTVAHSSTPSILQQCKADITVKANLLYLYQLRLTARAKPHWTHHVWEARVMLLSTHHKPAYTKYVSSRSFHLQNCTVSHPKERWFLLVISNNECKKCKLLEIVFTISQRGARGSVVVKALCYKPEGRGFDTPCGDFYLPNPYGRTRSWDLLDL
jgi:hypothetical protein